LARGRLIQEGKRPSSLAVVPETRFPNPKFWMVVTHFGVEELPVLLQEIFLSNNDAGV